MNLEVNAPTGIGGWLLVYMVKVSLLPIAFIVGGIVSFLQSESSTGFTHVSPVSLLILLLIFAAPITVLLKGRKWVPGFHAIFNVGIMLLCLVASYWAGMILPATWLLYWLTSKRVKNTYSSIVESQHVV